MGFPTHKETRRALGAGLIIAGTILATAGGSPNAGAWVIQLGIGLFLSTLGSTPAIEASIVNRSITHKGATEPWRVIYGKHRVGGVYAFIHLTGDTDEILNLVIVLAGHEVETIGGSSSITEHPTRIYMNGQPVEILGLNGQALAPPETLLLDSSDVNTSLNKFLFTAHGYATNQRIRFKLVAGGTLPGGIIDSQPYFIIKLDLDEFQISKRFTTESNPTHVINLTSGGTGDFEMKLDSEIIDYSGHLTVNKRHGSSGQSALNSIIGAVGDTGIWSTDHKLGGKAYAHVRLKWNRDVYPNGIPNITFDVEGKKIWDPRLGGDPSTDIAFSSNPALIITDYLMDSSYGMEIPVEEINQSKLIAAADICDEDVVVALPAIGTERRYEANGSFKINKQPAALLRELLTSMAGKVVRVGGKWEIFAGAYITPTQTYDESDMSAGFKAQNLIDRRDNYNGIRGTFVSPLDNWQPTSFPLVSSAGALSGDQGRENIKDLSFPWTLSPSTAQRLAKIELNKILESLSIDLQGKLTMFKSQPPDTIQYTNERLGFSAKDFEITDAGLTIGDTGAVNYRMKLRETNPGIYDWDETLDETDFVTTRNSILPNPFRIQAPTGLALTSGTNDLFIRLDGTIFSRIHATFVSPADEYVKSGGTIEVQFKKSADSDWLNAPTLVGSENEFFLLDVEDGVSYDVQIRSRNTIGVTSAYHSSLNHVVIGKTAPPGNVSGFFASQNEANVLLTWTQVQDKDLKGYNIKFGIRGIGINYDSAFFLTQISSGTSHTTAAIPPGDWTIFIKAVDTTGNESVNADSANIVVTTFNPTVKGEDDAPEWFGTKLHFIRHYTGVLVPASQNRAEFTGSGGDNFDIFDNFVQNPFPESIYTTEEFDLGREGTVRVFSSVAGSLGPEPLEGEIVTAETEVRWADDSGIFTPWKQLISVNKIFARKIQYRLRSDNSAGIAFYSSYTGSVDVEPRSEGATDVEIPIDGLIIEFTLPFFVTPRIKVTPVGIIARYAGFTDRDKVQFTLHLRDFLGAPVAGVADWEATTFSLNV